MRNFRLLITYPLAYIILYFAYFPFTVVIAEIFTITLILIQGTGFETSFFKIFSYTPTLGLWGKSTFEGGIELVIKFFAFWSFIFLLLDKLIILITGNKLKIRRIFLIFFTIIHILAIVRRWNTDMTFAIIFFYFMSVCLLGTYYLLKKLSQTISHKSS